MDWNEYVKRNGVPEWPYPIRYGEESSINTDVLVMGGGIAGCWAAISAARRGVDVVLVEKGATINSGAGGTGCALAQAGQAAGSGAPGTGCCCYCSRNECPRRTGADPGHHRRGYAKDGAQ